MHRRAVRATVRRNRLHPWRVRQHAECCAQNAFCVLVTPLGVRAHLLERSACFYLAKTEGAQRAKCFRMGLGNARIHHGSISSAVRVANYDTSRHAAFKDELSAVLGPVMRGAEDDEFVGVVSAALGTELQVVDVHKNRVGTAWNDTPAAVPPHDLAAHGRRHILSRPRRAPHYWRRAHGVCFCVAAHVGTRLLHWESIADVRSTLDVGAMATHVGSCSGGRWHATQVLRVAAGHLHNFRAYERGLTIALLPTAAAFLADVERNLIGCAARFAGAAQHMSGHEKERGIVVHRTAELASELRNRFPKRRVGLCQDFEPKDVRRRRRIARLTRSVTEAVSPAVMARSQKLMMTPFISRGASR
jgi:hypothetical protein